VSTIKTIALEEHYATTTFMDGPGRWLAFRPKLAEALLDLGEGRITASLARVSASLAKVG
jgi:hypothetical protein